MEEQKLIFILIGILSASGFLLSRYIYKTKRTEAPLVCPINGKCDQVIHSSYSRFLGIPLELIGMTYYSIIAIAYILFFFLGNLMPEYIYYLIVAFTASAFFFSIYLTLLQMFVLKSWCTWCLFSAGLCTIIFFLVIYVSGLNLSSLINPENFVGFW